MDSSTCRHFNSKRERRNENIRHYVSNGQLFQTGESILWIFFSINAPGALRIPCIPKELLTFTGPIQHTAEWNHKINLENKKVAIIGSGATAVQVIPSIANVVHTLHCYQRKPPYIIPRLQFTFPNFLKAIFRSIPFVMWLLRWTIYVLHEILYCTFKPDSSLRSLCK